MILNWNSWAAARDRALEIASWSELRPEVWVIDNGSRGDDLARLRSALPMAHVLDAGRNLGFGGGVNLALSRIAAPFTLLLNHDAGLDQGAARDLLALLETRSDIAVAGPALTDPAGRIEALGGRDIRRHVRTHVRPAEGGGPPATGPLDVAYVPGTAALLRTEAVRAVGGLDESFFFSGEMPDLCRRLVDRGWRCVVLPTARAWHDRGGRGARREALDAYYSLRNRFLFLRKHPAPGRRLFWTLYAVASALRHLLRGRARRAGAELLALAHGLRGRFGDAHAELGW